MRGFTGHRHNDDLGLIYMNARLYVSGIGRFASADTLVPDLANPQSFNRYSYVYNNPLNLVDPSGHKAMEADPISCGKPDGCYNEIFTPDMFFDPDFQKNMGQRGNPHTTKELRRHQEYLKWQYENWHPYDMISPDYSNSIDNFGSAFDIWIFVSHSNIIKKLAPFGDIFPVWAQYERDKATNYTPFQKAGRLTITYGKDKAIDGLSAASALVAAPLGPWVMATAYAACQYGCEDALAELFAPPSPPYLIDSERDTERPLTLNSSICSPANTAFGMAQYCYYGR